nr:putative 4-hydroxybenzoate polyprenyltransferase [Saprospiraceae bacterium]
MSTGGILSTYFSLIKISHTIFALPFAFLGFFIGVKAVGSGSHLVLLLLITLCMFFARSAAMAFNRYADRKIDIKNPRTAVREIPSGKIAAARVLGLVVLNCLAFITTTWFINPLCFYLSPLALLIVLGYSYTKRFTLWCHFVLGLGLALAPVGAYIAVTGYFDIIPILFGWGVLFWVAGFDIIYALQDEEFDRRENLISVPVVLGRDKGLGAARMAHFISVVFFMVATWLMIDILSLSGGFSYAGLLVFTLLLIFQHRLVRAGDLSRVNLAFFTTNGIGSILFAGFLILDLISS